MRLKLGVIPAALLAALICFPQAPGFVRTIITSLFVATFTLAFAAYIGVKTVRDLLIVFRSKF